MENLLQQEVISTRSDPSFSVLKSPNTRTKAITKEKQEKQKEKIEGQKEAGITSEEEYAPFVKTSFTLRDYDPKGFFGNDFSEDDLAEGELTQCYRFSWVDE